MSFIVASRNNKSNLFGKTDEEKTKVLEWSSWANSNLLGALAAWCVYHTETFKMRRLTDCDCYALFRFRPIVAGPFNKKASDDGKAQASKYFGILDQYLADKTFLVGQRITYADLITAAAVQRGCDHVSVYEKNTDIQVHTYSSLPFC